MSRKKYLYHDNMALSNNLLKILQLRQFMFVVCFVFKKNSVRRIPFISPVPIQSRLAEHACNRTGRVVHNLGDNQFLSIELSRHSQQRENHVGNDPCPCLLRLPMAKFNEVVVI